MARYIDADKLEQELELGWKKSIKRYDGEMATIFHILLVYVQGTPSADVEEVRHGRWRESVEGWDDTVYMCSECGEGYVTIDGTPADNLWNYCPNCGAKMDLKGKKHGRNSKKH